MSIIDTISFIKILKTCHTIQSPNVNNSRTNHHKESRKNNSLAWKYEAMSINFSNNISGNRHKKDSKLPQPGGIWEIKRGVCYPPEFPQYQQNKLYSDVATKFLAGHSSRRLVMIVTVPPTETQIELNGQLVSVMVLSSQTSFLSDVDLLIPKDISGLEQDVLAETWLVKSTLCSNLLEPVGKRLSRQVYDLLLDVGDFYHGLIEQPPTREKITANGLKIGSKKASSNIDIQAFHQHEVAWSDVLTLPVVAYYSYTKAFGLTEAVFNEALEVERDLFEVNNFDVINSQQASKMLVSRINLSRWLHCIFDPGWQEFFFKPSFIAITRSTSENNLEPNQEEITDLIQQLSSQNEYQQQKAVKRLASIGVGNALVIEALVNLLRTTQNDETLWKTIESLRKIDPSNPAAGIRRVKQIDLGMQLKGIAVALVVSLIEKQNHRVSILLKVYPVIDNTYLPLNLRLMLLDEQGHLLREVTSRDADIYIQLKLNGIQGENFSVRVALGEVGITEDFTI